MRRLLCGESWVLRRMHADPGHAPMDHGVGEFGCRSVIAYVCGLEPTYQSKNSPEAGCHAVSVRGVIWSRYPS